MKIQAWIYDPTVTVTDCPPFVSRSLFKGRKGIIEGTTETDLFLHGENCVDMDECVTGDHDCDEFHGECMNRFLKYSRNARRIFNHAK